MRYAIELKKSALKQLKRLDPTVRDRIVDKIYLLSENPFGFSSEQMSGLAYRKLRVGDYRVVYEVKRDMLVILIIRVGHRREVYRRLA